jgi:hypothetical protein
MTTEAQALANRQNALKSTGPRTLEGKRKVSQNALFHGLSANQAVISTEKQADFELYRDTILEELEPFGAMEMLLAERIISLSWRLKRAVRIQNQSIEVMSKAKNNGFLEQLTKSLPFKGQPNDGQSNNETEFALGRLAIKDLSGQKVLERLLLYERRIEQSLYKTILELQRLKAIRRTNPLFNYIEEEESSPNTLI